MRFAWLVATFPMYRAGMRMAPIELHVVLFGLCQKVCRGGVQKDGPMLWNRWITSGSSFSTSAWVSGMPLFDSDPYEAPKSVCLGNGGKGLCLQSFAPVYCAQAAKPPGRR